MNTKRVVEKSLEDAADQASRQSGRKPKKGRASFEKWCKEMNLDVVSPTVYRFYNGDSLLYVGQTMDLANRLRLHRCKTPFFTEIDRVEVAELPDKVSMHFAEILLIRLFDPVYNVRDRSEYEATDSGEVTQEACDPCGSGSDERDHEGPGVRAGQRDLLPVRELGRET